MIYVELRTKTGSKKGTVMSADVESMSDFMYEWGNLTSHDPSYTGKHTLRKYGHLIGSNGVFVDHREVVTMRQITPESNLDGKRFMDELWRRFYAETDTKERDKIMEEIRKAKEVREYQEKNKNNK